MKIALTGTHSSGKTSLVNSLSKLNEFKNYTIFTERTKELKQEFNIKLNDDSELISQYIMVGERAKELFKIGDILCDRSIYDVCSYTLGSKSIEWKYKEIFVKGCVPLMKEYDVIIYVSPHGVELENNSLRSMDLTYRNKIDYTIKEMLKEYPPKCLIEVSGTTEERINKIKETLFT
jgi:nicotinamide riboside kinase